MNAIRGFDVKGEEVLYVPQNFILIRSGRRIQVEDTPSHLEELTLHFNENPIDKDFVDIVNIPDKLLKQFREYCDQNHFFSYKIALEIREYCEDFIQLDNVIGNKTFFEFALINGYDVEK